MNWVVIATALVFNAFASTHLVAWLITIKMYLLSCERLMGLIKPMKSKPHFMNGLVGSMVINFTIGYVKDFQFANMRHRINNVVVHPCAKLATNT